MARKKQDWTTRDDPPMLHLEIRIDLIGAQGQEAFDTEIIEDAVMALLQDGKFLDERLLLALKESGQPAAISDVEIKVNRIPR